MVPLKMQANFLLVQVDLEETQRLVSTEEGKSLANKVRRKGLKSYTCRRHWISMV
jgi:hypothetical protein